MNGDSVLLILSSHPELPGKLSDAGLRVNRHYMTNKTFVDGIPCAVFLNMVYDKKFMGTEYLLGFFSMLNFYALLVYKNIL